MNNIHQQLCSVLIACYQGEKYLKKSILSVYNQTYRPIECIVINDGSTDDSLQILKKLKENFADDKDFELKIFTTENRGVCASRNLALSKSKGSFIQYVDADDLLHPRKLAIHIDALNNNPNCSSVWNPLQRFEDNQEENVFGLIDSRYEITKKTNNAFKPQFISTVGLHRKKVYEEAGLFTESLKRWGDLEYQVRLMGVIENYIQFNTPMYYYRQHDNGRISDMFNQEKGIVNGFNTLKSLSNYLSPYQKKVESIRKEMRDMYLSLFKTSVINNLKNEAIKSLRYSLNWSSNLKFSIKINVLIICILILPLFLIKLILKINGFIS